MLPVRAISIRCWADITRESVTSHYTWYSARGDELSAVCIAASDPLPHHSSVSVAELATAKYLDRYTKKEYTTWYIKTSIL